MLPALEKVLQSISLKRHIIWTKQISSEKFPTTLYYHRLVNYGHWITRGSGGFLQWQYWVGLKYSVRKNSGHWLIKTGQTGKNKILTIYPSAIYESIKWDNMKKALPTFWNILLPWDCPLTSFDLRCSNRDLNNCYISTLNSVDATEFSVSLALTVKVLKQI